MDAFSAMTLGDLPPVGEGVCLKPPLPLPAFRGYRDLWLNSGTAALALAFLHAHWQRLEVKQPEVLLPAYGCPDLVAAAVYAGVKPVLVDIQKDDPSYDLDALQKALNENTLAVVAVNFLGVRERLELLRQVVPREVILVEDNAQWHPESDAELEGEYVVTSFGRGKPASVLGGGLLLLRQDLPFDRDWVKEQFAGNDRELPNPLQHRLKVMAYNQLRKPSAYFFLNRSGLFKLGETRYEPLQGISAMSPVCQSLVSSNVMQHMLRDRWREQFYDKMLSDIPHLHSIANHRRMRLLRYPLLCDDEYQRDELLRVLSKQGLGASPLYGRPLQEIPGVDGKVATVDAPANAAVFAKRLLSLPLHSGVTVAHLEKAGDILQRSMKREALRSVT